MRSQSNGQGVQTVHNQNQVVAEHSQPETEAMADINLQINGHLLVVDPSLQDPQYTTLFRSPEQSNSREDGTTSDDDLRGDLYSRASMNIMNLQFPHPSSFAHSSFVYSDDPSMVPTGSSPLLVDSEDAMVAGRASSPDGALSESSVAPYRSLRLPPILQVEKQHVTTSATQAASASRRRNDALFKCPVPGCGSTFTRRFNLRGHLRSHTEERPFVCDWPGCGKGFARSHDCKRHTALHTAKSGSHVCAGCAKTFSRTDALNRHLKSEVGAPCREILSDAAQQERMASGQRDVDNGPRPVPFAT